MYKIMIVDDEPPIIRNAKRIIEKSSLNFEVVGEAYNGVEALGKIALFRPDIVFTDIKMPVMDGISLIKNINELYPDIIPVIISGYQDFEYAREGLKLGVFDYLLKPIEPELLQKLLETLSEILTCNYKTKGEQILHKLIYSLPDNEEKIKHQYIGCKYFIGILVRRGSMPCRQNIIQQYDGATIIESLDVKSLGKYIVFDDYWTFEGVDANELLLILGYNSNDKIKGKNTAEAIYLMLNSKIKNITVVYTPYYFELSQLRDNFQLMNNTLNQCLVIGKTQLLSTADIGRINNIPAPLLNSSFEKKLSVLVQGRSIEQIKDDLLKLFQNWEQNSYPQIWVEKMLKQILRLIEKNSSEITSAANLSNDQAVEEVISLSTDFGGLLRGIWEIIQDTISAKGADKLIKEDSYALMEKIEMYICNNISQPISLQGVCDLFGISQPYFSRLFRKYRNLSFNEYLTNMRISEARRLMDENADMLLKDIAEIVGYQDQHYFSRLYKSITGLSPSEYKKSLQI